MRCYGPVITVIYTIFHTTPHTGIEQCSKNWWEGPIFLRDLINKLARLFQVFETRAVTHFLVSRGSRPILGRSSRAPVSLKRNKPLLATYQKSGKNKARVKRISRYSCTVYCTGKQKNNNSVSMIRDLLKIL